MEVANASMYDGSTAAAEAVLMAHRVTKRKKAVLAGNLHPHYRRDGRDRVAASPITSCVAAASPHGAAKISSRRSTTRPAASWCRSRTVFGHVHDLRPHRREGACGRRAADRGGHRSRVARPRHAAGRDGRRHRGRRGAVDRQCADLRRALCRAVRDAAEIRAADAGPARRRDGRCRRQARLRADALDARAAHPPREGDLEHLHEFRALHARLHDPPHAARRGRACAGSRGINHANAVALAEMRSAQCRASRC